MTYSADMVSRAIVDTVCRRVGFAHRRQPPRPGSVGEAHPTEVETGLVLVGEAHPTDVGTGLVLVGEAHPTDVGTGLVLVGEAHPTDVGTGLVLVGEAHPTMAHETPHRV
jgi:hypothetical protein